MHFAVPRAAPSVAEVRSTGRALTGRANGTPAVARCRTRAAEAGAPTAAVQSALSSQDAPTCAPRQSSRRIHVSPLLACPALLLADAVCWVLGDMRSTRCNRRAVLGSFNAVPVAARGPLVQGIAAGNCGATASVSTTATGFHLGHHGQADVALPWTRATAQLAARWLLLRGHIAGASARHCTAMSPLLGLPAHLVASVGARAPGITRIQCSGWLVRSRLHPTFWLGGGRLSAHAAPRTSCASASARASSMKSSGGGGGGGTGRSKLSLASGEGAARAEGASRRMHKLEEAVGAAGIALRSNFAVAPTASCGARAGGSKVGVVEFGAFAIFASTPTLEATAAVHLRPTRLGDVGVPDVSLASGYARTSTPSATLGSFAIGGGWIGVSDVSSVPASA